jgi:hypothetical protein
MCFAPTRLDVAGLLEALIVAIMPPFSGFLICREGEE